MDHSAEWWTAVFTALLFVATILLVAIAYFQIRAAREENRQTQTLLACGNYDVSDVIFRCRAAIADAKEKGELSDKAKMLRQEIMTVLNFLDAIAIGIEQELYIDSLAYAHLHIIVAGFVHDIVDTDVLSKADCNRDAYVHLIDLNARWARQVAGTAHR